MPLHLDFKALWANHRKELLLGGGAAAAGLGIYSARKRASDPSSSGGSDSSSGATAGVAQAANTATGAEGTYDSTPNDVYSAIQPQLEQTQGLLGQLLDTIQNLPSAVTVGGSTTATAAPGKVKKGRSKGRPGRPRRPRAQQNKPRGGTPHHATPRPKGHPVKGTHPKAHPAHPAGHAALNQPRAARAAGLKLPTPGGRASSGVRATAVPKAGGHVAVRLDRPQKVAIPTRAVLAPRPAPAPAKTAPAPRRRR